MAQLFFIPGEVYSSKNSRVNFESGVSIASEAVRRWKKETTGEFMMRRPQFLKEIQHRELPLLIGFHFKRKTRGRYDWNNMVQAVADRLQDMHYIADDDVASFIPVPLKLRGSFSTHDKQDPGVLFVVLDSLCEAETALDSHDRTESLVSMPEPVKKRVTVKKSRKEVLLDQARELLA